MAVQGLYVSRIALCRRFPSPQDAKTIVALTKLHESGREKCAQYWPETPNEEGAKTYGDVRVVAQPDQHLKDFTVRVFHATHLPVRRTIFVL